MSAWIEESPNSRATCRLCSNPIKKGEVRIGGDMGSGFSYHYHFDCWLRRNGKFVKDLLRMVLPRYFGDEAAQPLLIALELKEQTPFGGCPWGTTSST